VRRRNFTAGFLGLGVGLAAGVAVAQTVPSPDARIRKGKLAIDEVIAALGGQNFLTMRNRVERGRAYSFYREQVTGLSIATIYTEYAGDPEPGKLGLRERQAFGKKEDSAILFLDGQGFDVTFRGARPLPEKQLERYFLSTRHNIFYVLRQRLKEPGLFFEYVGLDVIENQTVNIIDVIDDNNEKITVWVNANTHLPVRQRWYRRDEANGDKFEEVTRFTKYHQSGGVTWPMSLQRERDTEKIAEIYDEHVTINADLKAGLFTLPSGIPILPTK
jgi:hypothetical protein